MIFKEKPLLIYQFLYFKVGVGIMDLVAKHLGIPLTKTQKEQQQPVVKAELVPPSTAYVRPVVTSQSNTSVCVLQ